MRLCDADRCPRVDAPRERYGDVRCPGRSSRRSARACRRRAPPTRRRTGNARGPCRPAPGNRPRSPSRYPTLTRPLRSVCIIQNHRGRPRRPRSGRRHRARRRRGFSRPSRSRSSSALPRAPDQLGSALRSVDATDGLAAAGHRHDAGDDADANEEGEDDDARRGRPAIARRRRRTAVPAARTRAASGSVGRTGRPRCGAGATAVRDRRGGVDPRLPVGVLLGADRGLDAVPDALRRGHQLEVRARRVTAATRWNSANRVAADGACGQVRRDVSSATVSVTASIASVCRRRASFDHLQTCSEPSQTPMDVALFTVPRGRSSVPRSHDG